MITTGVIPIACLRVDDVRFEFDSSFVRPEISDEIEHLADLREQHKIEINPTTGEVNQTTGVGTTGVIIFPPLSIFGHADSVNTDVYNKPLSGRRATAIYGLLTRDTDLWEELFHPHPASGDNWGVKSIQTMLTHLGISRGGAGGKMDDKTREDVKNFQRAKGLTVDGDPGPKTREKLFVTIYGSTMHVRQRSTSIKVGQEG
ncbi:MAG: peptidoglycan-binding protein [Pyrinomonadaceae bacterium]